MKKSTKLKRVPRLKGVKRAKVPDSLESLRAALADRSREEVEMSDEGLMSDDIAACLQIVIQAVNKSKLLASVVVEWCDNLRKRDRVGFIGEQEIKSLRNGLQTESNQKGNTMGRRCRRCGRHRPHERFGGKGYAASVCADCRQLPKAEQQRRLAIDEILGFLEQSNRSAKNIARLKELVSIADPRFQLLRELILEIALVAPHKRRRWKVLREHRLDLLKRAVDAGFVEELIEPDWDESDSGVRPQGDQFANVIGVELHRP